MATMSKRAQARTERELQEILNQPGNTTCVDCGARNPAWASWSIGVFLCMRCATLHRKLGTHISKVKSLTMDTWTDEQVQNMRTNGNNAVNQTYNPKNKKPDMPLDADEVDNAMERFIRKKYQEKSLSDGKPEVPTRDNLPTPRSKSPDTEPSPILPPKKKSFWTGFGLRASSSAYPLTKHDKKHRNETRVDGPSRISSEDYTSKSKPESRTISRRDVTGSEIEAKMLKLREMGFMDIERNTILLKKARGDVELVIASLVKHAAKENGSRGPISDTSENSATAHKPGLETGAHQREALTEPSNNPFNRLDQVQHDSTVQFQQPPVAQNVSANTNPWQTAMSPQQDTGLEQPFGAMHVNPSPLFPHNTGGYAAQSDPRFSQSMTPPVPSMPQAYSATASPISSANPFTYQTPLSAHSTGSNPYAANMLNTPSFAPATNPFLINNGSQPTSPSLTNPFGLPPAQTQLQPNPAFAPVQTSPSMLNGQQNQAASFQSNFHQQSTFAEMSSPAFSNFNYGQPPGTFSPQVQSPQSPQGVQHSYASQQQQQPPTAQQTGRYDKTSIMALYNFPQYAPQRQLAAIPEPAESEQPGQDLNASQPLTVNTSTRSVSMPIQSAGQVNRNPFTSNNAAVVANTTSPAQSTPSFPQFSPLGQNNPYANANAHTKAMASGNPFGGQGGARHTSADSISVNNPALIDGRHSPDVWGGLSARYVK